MFRNRQTEDGRSLVEEPWRPGAPINDLCQDWRTRASITSGLGMNQDQIGKSCTTALFGTGSCCTASRSRWAVPFLRHSRPFLQYDKRAERRECTNVGETLPGERGSYL